MLHFRGKAGYIQATNILLDLKALLSFQSKGYVQLIMAQLHNKTRPGITQTINPATLILASTEK